MVYIFSSSTTTVSLVSFRSLIVIFSSTCSKEAGLVRKGDKKKKKQIFFLKILQLFSRFFTRLFPFFLFNPFYAKNFHSIALSR